jgi:hypothetical protein
LDIEIAPTLATVWGLFNQNIAINQITGNSYVLSWAAKWYGEDEIYYSSLRMTSSKNMIKEIYKMVEQADVIVGYNLDSFDMKVLNKEFVLLGLDPPSSYRTVDLLKTVRKRFRFTSNKLDFVVQQLGLGKKVKHPGHELWLNCMNKSSSEYESSWDLMEEYNVGDVDLTEKLYDKLKGWIPNHPNHSAFNNSHCCPNCGSTNLRNKGKYLSNSLVYNRWKCKDCGAPSRSRTADKFDRAKELVSIK